MSSLLWSCGEKSSYFVVLPSDNVGQSSNSLDNSPCKSGYYYGNKGNVPQINENSYYTTKEEVALYLVTYKKLPSNYMTKNNYNNMTNSGTDLPAGSSTRIGGDRYYNSDGDLPDFGGAWSECDVNASGPTPSQRGSKRIVFTWNFRMFYTDDHYSHWQEYLGYNNWGPRFSSGGFVRICG